MTYAEEKYLIGIDGGATKTEFVLFTEQGDVVCREVLAGSNPNVCGMEATCAILKSGIDSLRKKQAQISGVFVGIAGYLSGDNGARLEAWFAQTYPELPVSMGSDICNVIASGEGKEDCIAVICGTGFVIYANKKDGLKRVGGWGYLLDNKGSGCDLGRDALRAALACYDGFGPHTVLLELAEEKLGGDIWKHIGEIYAGGNSFLASFAPLVFKACRMGDEAALQILEENTDRIVELVQFTAEKYQCGPQVVIAGGLIEHDATMRTRLQEKLPAGLTMVIPTLPQIYGACAECCKRYGVQGDAFREHFRQTYSDLIQKGQTV